MMPKSQESGECRLKPRAFALFAALALGFVAAAAPSHAPDAASAGAGMILVIKASAGEPQARIGALIAELGGKQALPDGTLRPPDTSPARPSPTSAELAERIWGGTTAALRAIPRLTNLPDLWRARTGYSGDAALSFDFWLVVIAGLLAAPLIGRAMRLLIDRRIRRVTAFGRSRLRIGALYLSAAAISLPVFAALFWLALLTVSTGNRFLEEVADRVVWAALEWRFAIAALIIVLEPWQADLRLLRIDGPDAARCIRWLGVYATIAPFDYCLIWLIERIGFPHVVLYGAALAFGIPTTMYKIVMLWAIRRPIARAILSASSDAPSSLRRATAAAWHWFFIVLALAILAAAVVAFSLGEGAAVYGAATMTQVIVVAMAVFWLASQKAIEHFFLASAADVAPRLRQQRLVQALRRLADALALILGACWLAEVWGLDVVSPPPGSLTELLLRRALLAAVTLVGAWMLWLVLSGIIDEKMPRLDASDNDDTAGSARASRLTTLLPLVRNLMLVGIGAIALWVALSALGLDLAPLLAAFGVIGITLGFGAQTLVRDVISGVFYLLDDAFRIGEYIVAGQYKGTVEGFGIRSIKLRHHRGPLYTVPFGILGAIQNQSRDWVIDKITIGVTYDSDLDLAKKLVKQIGLDLANEPEFAPLILEPLKLQGVDAFGDFAVQLRAKMKTLPGEQFVIRRAAYSRIKKAFDANGVKFAFPTVQVAGASDGESTNFAAAQQALQLTHQQPHTAE